VHKVAKPVGLTDTSPPVSPGAKPR